MTIKQKNLLVAAILAVVVAGFYLTSFSNELFKYENYKGRGEATTESSSLQTLPFV